MGCLCDREKMEWVDLSRPQIPVRNPVFTHVTTILQQRIAVLFIPQTDSKGFHIEKTVYLAFMTLHWAMKMKSRLTPDTCSKWTRYRTTDPIYRRRKGTSNPAWGFPSYPANRLNGRLKALSFAMPVRRRRRRSNDGKNPTVPKSATILSAIILRQWAAQEQKSAPNRLRRKPYTQCISLQNGATDPGSVVLHPHEWSRPMRRRRRSGLLHLTGTIGVSLST